MNRWGVKVGVGFGCALIALMLCTALDQNSPSITSTRGNVSIIRNRKSMQATVDCKVHPGDTIRIGDGQSGALIKFINGTKLYLNVGTVIALESVGRGNKSISLLQGECYYTQEDKIGGTDSITINTHLGVNNGTDADFLTYYNSGVSELIITVMNGITNLNHLGLDWVIPPCTRYSQIENESGQMQPPSVGELELLKQWVNTSKIEEILTKSGCTLQALSSENIPPQWVKLPEEAGRVGVKYTDTIRADDPEGHTLHYMLLKAPDGLQLDEVTGVIRYVPKTVGSFEVKIEATDSDTNKIQHAFSITVSEKTSLRLNIRGMVPLNEPVTLSAEIQHSTSRAGKALYRFDIDGDGKFDIPEGGAFATRSTIKNHQFTHEGVFTVVAEAKTAEGMILSTSKKVIVNAPPIASLVVKPVFISPSSSVVIDASGSSDTRDATGRLRVRFDTDGDGVWDIPSEGKFTKEHVFSHTFNKSGTTTVRVQVYDEQGLWDTASVNLFVSRGLNIKSIDGLDTANVGDSLSFVCNVAQPEFPIATYTWSLSGPEQLEISKNNKRVSIALSKEGAYVLSCAIVDSKEQSAKASRTLIVVNSPTQVDAGGPYSVSVNSVLSVQGKASDKDSKIIGYSWDFDGDGIADTQLVDKSPATWIYKKGGVKKISLSVQTSDGMITTDEAVVNVTNTAPTVEAGKDILARSGRKVELSGVASDSENNICEYAWDFDGNGSFDWTSADTGYVEHAFKEYSRPVFRVTDCDGAFATDTLNVVVCPEGMEAVEHGKFCVDMYEWPNKKNDMPQLDVSYEEATQLCKDAGKRLCTDSEWVIACKSDKAKWDYPYGRKYELDNCNNLGNGFSKNKPAVSGYFQNCVGTTGAFDMSGNAAEWVNTETGSPYVYGGSWQNGPVNSKCESKVQLERGKKYFYAGFRCCK